MRRQPNDYLDTECERLRPFVLWKLVTANSERRMPNLMGSNWFNISEIAAL